MDNLGQNKDLSSQNLQIHGFQNNSLNEINKKNGNSEFKEKE